ncbi:MAG: bifunctional 5,10-methylenetetrahydrofolate dehydrogenase/5,10-methenyltetrahydrofolate cyclohydrolase [bacterium]|nr:bifunctional 5,10-methylenetetrahydrofolate dehydrogenase/5,10-methenyltetrahydrofolate cyclohydrolase [bacterium]
MQQIDGRAIAAQIQQEIKEEIERLGITPGLAVILVGNNPASHLYVSLKEKAAKEVGIYFEKHLFSGTEPESEILARIQELNERDDIHGIIVQVPLPPQYSEDIVISQMDPKKDADGFHQVNLRALLSGEPKIFPAVALAIMALIDEAVQMIRSAAVHLPLGGAPDAPEQSSVRGRQDLALQNKKAVLIVNRTEFAAPVEYLLEERGALVNIMLHKKEMTPDAIAKLRTADIVVTARGRANFITGNMVKDGAIVIDVGTNTLPDGKMVGDVDFQSTGDMQGFITPVPGGVGPMTVAMLLKNTLELAKIS